MIAVLITVLIAFLIAQAIATAALILVVREVAKALPQETAEEQRGEEQDAERKEEDDAQPDNALGLFWDGGPIYLYDTLSSLGEDDVNLADLQQSLTTSPTTPYSAAMTTTPYPTTTCMIEVRKQ
ncbi:hypothetical protein GSI_09410 [Ganoderma sinense ZZ0214-1]|uniref:Uncharacterized protein n=1 Tax=Ganoderma sinense ZZ0214-1 TaxID=1077348 RepID=A0A2G8S6E7_9APHY|nr:hypothetical protein GSI_09410 [Ganoderma sinense ZZ0214-1]